MKQDWSLLNNNKIQFLNMSERVIILLFLIKMNIKPLPIHAAINPIDMTTQTKPLKDSIGGCGELS